MRGTVFCCSRTSSHLSGPLDASSIELQYGHAMRLLTPGALRSRLPPQLGHVSAVPSGCPLAACILARRAAAGSMGMPSSLNGTMYPTYAAAGAFGELP